MLSYIEINRDNLVSNISGLKNRLKPGTRIVAVIKGNAYGHGMAEVATVLEDHCDYYGVVTIEDIRTVRAVSSKPILVLGYIAHDDLDEAFAAGAALTVSDLDRLHQINEIGKRRGARMPVHIKIDAALGRQGILVSELEPVLRSLKDLVHVQVDGIYAHFANIEDTRDFSHAKKQIALFAEARRLFHAYGYDRLLTHISSTAGSLIYEQDHGYNPLVRLGLGMYGMWPSEYLTQEPAARGLTLKPVIRWVSHLAQVRTLPAGSTIGYGLTYRTEKSLKVAVVPQGYSDGYDRGLSNIGEMLVAGTRCRVLGRVAMNMVVIDVDHLPNVTAEDEVVLLGTQGDERITAEEIAAKIDTINYEVTTRISPLLPRVVV